jgi:hypothetical protein
MVTVLFGAVHHKLRSGKRVVTDISVMLRRKRPDLFPDPAV